MSIQTENKNYSVENTNFKGYLAWDDSVSEARPGVLVFPEWWGLNEYIQKRTEQVAELGYLALGVDMYGEGKTVDNPEEAGSLMNVVLEDQQIIKARVEVAYNVLKEHTLSDSERLGAIGYCFGGALVLNMARMGMELLGWVADSYVPLMDLGSFFHRHQRLTPDSCIGILSALRCRSRLRSCSWEKWFHLQVTDMTLEDIWPYLKRAPGQRSW